MELEEDKITITNNSYTKSFKKTTNLTFSDGSTNSWGSIHQVDRQNLRKLYIPTHGQGDKD